MSFILPRENQMRIYGALMTSFAVIATTAAHAQVDPAAWSQPLVLSIGEAGQAHLMGPLLPEGVEMDAATACAQLWNPVVGATYTILGLHGEVGHGEVLDCTLLQTSEGTRIVAPLAGVELPADEVAVGLPTTSVDNFVQGLVDCSASIAEGELKAADCSAATGSALSWHPVDGEPSVIADAFASIPFVLPRLEGGLSLVVVTPLGEVALWQVSQSDARLLLQLDRP